MKRTELTEDNILQSSLNKQGRYFHQLNHLLDKLKMLCGSSLLEIVLEHVTVYSKK